MRSPLSVVGIAVLGAVTIGVTAQLFVHSVTLFDDAFISYRYARNLAEGLGLVWNPGERTEGYTNFLLVIVIAPFLRLGADPLLVARVIGLLALASITVVLYINCRKRFGASPWIAAVCVAPFLLVANALKIVMAGIETLPFAFFVVLAIHFLLEYAESGSVRVLSASFACQFFAFLLRPEALLVSGLAAGYLMFRASDELRTANRLSPAPLLAGLWLVVPVGIYLLWKYWYFGHVLPNPYYLKVADSPALELRGLRTVAEYGSLNSVLILLVLLSTLLNGTRYRIVFAIGLLYIGLHVLFYARVDPMMNHGNRFLYPITPILYLLFLPLAVAAYHALEQVRGGALIKVLVAFGVLHFLSRTTLRETNMAIAAVQSGLDRSGYASVYKRYEIGRVLAEYPYIENISLATGDAGVLPYVIPSRVLDIVGLNDRFIATTDDYDSLVKYVFSQEITLMLHAANPDLTPIDWGHGRLGKMDRWVNNPHAQWDDYEYVGTLENPRGGHEYHLLLRNDYRDFDVFKDFLVARIVDRYDERFTPTGSKETLLNP